MKFERGRFETAAGTAWYTMVRPGRALASLEIDTALLTNMVDDNGLINQTKTEARLGRKPGLDIAEVMARYPVGSVGFCPSNWLWQQGEIVVLNGEPVTMQPDPLLRDGHRSLLGQDTSGSWCNSTVVMAGSYVSLFGPRRLRLGLSYPLVIDSGERVPIRQLVGEPRVFVDPRNLVQFNAGRSVDPNFFQLIRPMMPNKPHEVSRLLNGFSVEATKKLDAFFGEEYDQLSRIILQSLSDVLSLGWNSDGVTLRVLSRLPTQRLPLNLFGIDNDGEPILVSVDGRQEGSAGVSFDEGAELLLHCGAQYGGIGAAGGDVAMVCNDLHGMKVLNCPSNPGGSLRRVPSLLVFPPN